MSYKKVVVLIGLPAFAFVHAGLSGLYAFAHKQEVTFWMPALGAALAILWLTILAVAHVRDIDRMVREIRQSLTKSTKHDVVQAMRKEHKR